MNTVNISLDKLTDILSFDENIETVTIEKEYQLGNDAVMVVCLINDELIVPFIYYAGKEWIFTPQDWQSWTPGTPEEISEINWRVNDTETFAVIFNGLPMLAPGTPEPVSCSVNKTRMEIGAALRHAREDAGMTLRDVSNKAGIRFSHLARIERGRNGSNIDTLANIAAVLGMKLTLMSVKTDKKKKVR